MNSMTERALAETIIRRAIETLIEQGVSGEIIIDRLLTYASFYAVQLDDKATAAASFHAIAERIAAGIFDNVKQPFAN